MNTTGIQQSLLFLVLALCLGACGESDTPTTNIYEGDAPGECDNGADDDRDGRYDCDDEDCVGAPVCQINQSGNAGTGGDAGGEAGSGGDAGGDTGTGGDAGDSGDAGAEAGAGGEAGTGGEACLTDEAFLETQVWSQVIADRCVGCHQQGGLAQYTDMVFRPDTIAGWQAYNLAQITQVVTATHDGTPLILLKPTGRHPDGHSGGQLLIEDSDEYRRLSELVGRILDDVDDCGNAVGSPLEPGDDCEVLTPGRRLLRRLSHVEYQHTIRDLLGVHIDAKGAFVADTVDHGFENHPERLDVTGLLADQYREMAESLADIVDIEPLLPCTIAEGDVNCAHRFIADFGKRAYRRPLMAEEIAAYRNLYRLVVEQACFEDGIRWVIIGMLQWPHFLYRSELGRRDGDSFVLTPYEIASEISYLLWQTMPDDALFAAAADGSLLDPTVAAEHVRRLLGDPRSNDMMNDFVGHWLELDGLMQVVRDSEIYAALYFELREAMKKETMFFVGDLWDQNAPLSTLFASESSWINDELATYYNVDIGAAPANAEGFHQGECERHAPGWHLDSRRLSNHPRAAHFVLTHSQRCGGA